MGKVSVLFQTHVQSVKVEEFSLVSDMAYVVDNAGRLLRAIFEMALSRGLCVFRVEREGGEGVWGGWRGVRRKG
jgi:hypothetical protein